MVARCKPYSPHLAMLKIFDELETKRPGTREGIPRAEGELLYLFIKEHRIKRVIETGAGWGFSSYYILAALPEDGHLFSIESNCLPHTGLVVPIEWRKRWSLIIGTSREGLLESFTLYPNIDLFFHDSNHYYETQIFEYETALPFVKFIGSHDIHLYGPKFAWDEFLVKYNLKVLLTHGQLGIAQGLKTE